MRCLALWTQLFISSTVIISRTLVIWKPVTSDDNKILSNRNNIQTSIREHYHGWIKHHWCDRTNRSINTWSLTVSKAISLIDQAHLTVVCINRWRLVCSERETARERDGAVGVYLELGCPWCLSGMTKVSMEMAWKVSQHWLPSYFPNVLAPHWTVASTLNQTKSLVQTVTRNAIYHELYHKHKK